MNGLSQVAHYRMILACCFCTRLAITYISHDHVCRRHDDLNFVRLEVQIARVIGWQMNQLSDAALEVEQPSDIVTASICNGCSSTEQEPDHEDSPRMSPHSIN